MDTSFSAPRTLSPLSASTPAREGMATDTCQDVHAFTHTRNQSCSRLGEALRSLLWGHGHGPHEPRILGLSHGAMYPGLRSSPLAYTPGGVGAGGGAGAPLVPPQEGPH